MIRTKAALSCMIPSRVHQAGLCCINDAVHAAVISSSRAPGAASVTSKQAQQWQCVHHHRAGRPTHRVQAVLPAGGQQPERRLSSGRVHHIATLNPKL